MSAPLEIIFKSIASEWVNQFIFLAALLNSFFLFKAYKNISLLQKALFKGDSVIETFIKERMGQKQDVEERIRTNFSHWEALYKETTRWYHLFSNTITVFPLLGIGGTILSIIPTMLDFSQVNTYFSLALVSTLLGVVFATIFKFFEGYLSGNYTLISERMRILTDDITQYILEKEQKATLPTQKNAPSVG